MDVCRNLESKSVFQKNHDLTAGIFSKRLIRQMNKKRLKLSDLANHFDVEEQTISRWRTGDNLPSAEKLIGLSLLLGVSLDWLFGLSDYETGGRCGDDLKNV